MPPSRYLAATERIPPGETRTFLELAALAARSGAARAAARALRAAAPEASEPWHRVVAADGSLLDGGVTGEEQLRRLRAEGARPREGEAVCAWARRVGVSRVGRLPARVDLSADDPEVDDWPPLAVEPLAARAAATARGFVPPGTERVEAPGAPARPRRPLVPRRTLDERLDAVDWEACRRALPDVGWSRLPRLLAARECADLLAAGSRPELLERTVELRRHGYGIGAYDYFVEPPPAPVATVRERLYAELRPVAGRLVSPTRPASFPPTLTGFHRRCRRAGQRRGSCILLRYGEGGVNHPHRDLYGDVWFPAQALVVLSRRGRDFEGGELVLLEDRDVEERERRVIPVDRGDVVVFASAARWERGEGSRPRKVPLLHGMDPVTRGERFAAGIVFHLAR